jgi:hypothetical protein
VVASLLAYRFEERAMRPPALLITIIGVLLAAPAAGAVVMTAGDPSDAPDGAEGKTDLRAVTWTVNGAASALTVTVDASTYGAGVRAALGVHALLDTDRDGLADAEVTAVRNADGVSVDWVLRSLTTTDSTGDCQDLTGSVIAFQDGAASTVSSGLETSTFNFASGDVPGGLGYFRWAAFGQSPPDAATAGPWDYLPDASNPDSLAANPGDRRCGATKGGLRLRMASGIDTDTVAPVAQPAHPLVPSAQRLGTTRVPIRFRWAATDNVTPTGSLSYDVQVRDITETSWTQVVDDSTVQTATKSLAPGHTYQVRDRARDAAGNESPYAVSAKFKVKAVQENAAGYTGTWPRVARHNAYGGKVRTTATKGATAQFGVTGHRGIGVVMPLRSHRSVAKICLRPHTDGPTCDVLDLGNGHPSSRTIVFARNGLDPTLAYTVKVTVVKGRVDIDALVLLA